MPAVTSRAEILGLGTNGALVIDSGGDVRATSSKLRAMLPVHAADLLSSGVLLSRPTPGYWIPIFSLGPGCQMDG